ncbi:barstar family protein [Streptomyces sp. SD31]|uniref:barstar family protein n=1 Tax=Streptomyces sp. SD31 TaxID=3452208 RepID=UPI003F8C90B7
MSTATWILPLTAAAGEVQARRGVRGSHCRTSRDLFTEWAAALGFPDHFGHNWDAFRDCLLDVVQDTVQASSLPLTIVVREADQLLADEPESVLVVFLEILGEAGGGTAPRLLLLVDDTPDGLARLVEAIPS